MGVRATTWVWENSKSEGSDRLVLLALADFADDNGDCFGSWGTMSKKTRLSLSTIARSVRRLRDAGELIETQKSTVRQGRNMATVWQIPMGGVMSNCEGGNVRLTGGWCQIDTPTKRNSKEQQTQSPQAAPVTAAAQPPQDKQNPSPPLSSEKAKRKSAFDPTSIPLPHGPRFRHAWGEWVQHRKEKRSPLTPLAASKQLKDLAALSEDDAMDCVCKSIKNGWTGLFADNYGSKGKPSVRPSNVIPVRKSAGFDEEMAEFRALARA
jgi:hypothetical protein